MNPDNMMEMIITVIILLIEIALILFCVRRLRAPVNLAKPRLFPYNGAIAFLGLAILVTTAHTYSVYTGHRLESRNKMNRGGMGVPQQQPMR